MSNNKILIVVNDFTTIYNFRIEFIEFLKNKGFKVTIALPEDIRNDKLTNMGFEVHPILLSRFGTNPFVDIRCMLEIHRIIKQLRPLVVLTYTAKPNIYGGLAARLSRTPYICNVTGLGSNLQSKNTIASIMLFLQKIAFKKAFRIFFQNESNLDYFLSKKIIKNKYDLLPGSGVNLKENPYEEPPMNNPITFITIARIRKDKGYDELLYAIKKLHEEGIKANFILIGWYEDETYKNIMSDILKYGNVKIIDGVAHDKIHDLIKKSDCLIHPSHHEGMSNVILEAAASGRPCIVSDINGCIEGVDKDISGFYFKVKDGESLLSAIKKFLLLDSYQIKQMGIKANYKMQKEFDRNIVIDSYYNLIVQIQREKTIS